MAAPFGCVFIYFSDFTIFTTCVRVQVWAKGAKPSDAGESDIECKESSWGVGANITTKLVNPAGEVTHNHVLICSVSI